MAKISLAGNGSQTIRERDVTLSGFLIAVTSTTPSAITPAVLQGINITAMLYRPALATPTVVMQGDAFSIAKASNPGSVEAVAQSTGNYTGLRLNFGGRVIQLDNEDELRVTISVTGAAAGQSITVSTEYAVGIEDVTPTVTVYNALVSPATQNLSFGDNVIGISIIETNTSPRVIGLNLAASSWSCDYADTEFAALRSDQYFTNVVPTTTMYCVNIYNGPSLHNVRGSLYANPAGTSNGAIVCFGGFTNPQTVARAIDTAAKIEKRELSRAMQV